MEGSMVLYFPCEKSRPLFVDCVFGSLSFQDIFLQLAAVGQAFRAAMMLSGSPNQKKMSTLQILSRLGGILGVGEPTINRTGPCTKAVTI